MNPTIGRIVHYKLTEQDAQRVAADRLAYKTPGNYPQAGEVYPALIVRVWDTLVNLQVFLDGPDSLWVTSRKLGDDEGEWAWPSRDTRGLDKLEK